jgi:hypothetical protein
MRLAPLLAAAAVLLVLVPAVRADVLDDAAATLQRQSVYQAPGTTTLSQADVARLRDQIASSGEEIHIAVLPDTAGDPITVLRTLDERIGGHGVLGVVVGRHFRAGANRDVGFSAAPMATEAMQAHPGDPAAVLSDFVHRVDERASGGGDGTAGGLGGPGALVLLGLFVLFGGGVVLLLMASGRRRRRERAAQLADVRRTANEDLVALGDDIRALDLDVEMPGADPQAKADYDRAVAGYDAANRRLATARSVDELRGLGEQLEDARFAMASAKARLAGQPPPERRPPCFFDPRHGPSVTDVDWAPPGGAARPVPVCAADATAIADGRQPATRQVQVGGQIQPWWAAPTPFAGYYGGYFSPFGMGSGFLGGLLVGDLLGHAWGGYGWGGVPVGVDQGWGGDFGGDFGDGDFGGGDFGGGDFGGGDFGGGDFGGGGDF